jgi:hypothetical protein
MSILVLIALCKGRAEFADKWFGWAMFVDLLIALAFFNMIADSPMISCVSTEVAK